eukprot:COSAG02_NODE_8814_length_2435_cov_1.459760_2_plen_75_part_00
MGQNTFDRSRGGRYNLRARKPRRTDADLCAVYDGVSDHDCLRYIALLATVMPKHSYNLRRYRKNGAVRAFPIQS